MTLSVKGELLFRGTANAHDMAELMRHSLKCLIRNGMRYFDQEETDLHRSPPAMDKRLAEVGVILEDDESPYVLMLEPRYSPKEKYHFLTVRSGSDLELDELPTEWRRLTLRLRHLIETVRPTAVIAWGTPSGREDEPNLGNLALGRLPLDIASWTYLSNELLGDSTASQLAQMPGVSTETLRFGRVVELGSMPGKPFDDAIRSRFRSGKHVRFFDPMVS